MGTVRLRSKGKAKKERTGIITDRSSEVYHRDMDIAQQLDVVCMRTGLIIEKGSEIDDNSIEKEVADAMYSLSPDVQPGHDDMGRIIIEDGVHRMMPRIIVEDGIQCMIPEKKLSVRERWTRKRLEHHDKDDTKKAVEEKHDAPTSTDQRWLERQERRREKEERDKTASTKAQAKVIMEENRQARRRARHRWKQGLTSSRRPAMSEAKQVMIRERQDKYLEELSMKYELQQQEGRYVKAPRYLHAASKAYADRHYREDAVEKAVEMMQTGTIDQSSRSVQIEQQITQDWQTRRKLSKRWAKIMKRRSKIRLNALKYEPYNKMSKRGSKVSETGTPTPMPLSMLTCHRGDDVVWKTHVMGDAVVTCGRHMSWEIL